MSYEEKNTWVFAFIAPLGYIPLSLAEVLDALETNRRALLATLEAIPPEAWDRAAPHVEIGGARPVVVDGHGLPA